MEGTFLSPAVTRMVGKAGALVSLQEWHALLGELAGEEVSAKQVERTAAALGAEVAKDERQQVEAASKEPLPPLPHAADALALALDGGEDYQLLFTVPPAKRTQVPPRFDKIPLHCVGEIQAPRRLHLLTPDGKSHPLEPQGYNNLRDANAEVMVNRTGRGELSPRPQEA
jgi:hypothetical protein